ncbi:hypothetical protein HG537_0B01480 [Torulaspora globosa]|uniref:SURP motif domain-containing protein n=1 Tax=Torulaspora globosa TaxID=48254 RepID=A0A7H9HNB4_9SACH|nr:hypothetical protein HG537_0B01480 [Torulaspora sp. CBS 2947]
MNDIKGLNGSVRDGELLREVIEKTAKYVVENGTNFEDKLKDEPKFSFVIPGDENYELYQQILSRERSSRSLEVGTFEQSNGRGNPEEPYVFSFSNYDENITQRDLEIIKLAAAYCVANENNNYLEKMRDEFRDDELLGFLKPDHALNYTFVQFVNQYKQVKENSLGLPFFEWRKNDYKYEILQRSFQRAEFNVYNEESRAKQDKFRSLQKIQFAAFDWTRFKVVNKVTVPTSDAGDLPAPLDFDKLALKRLEKSEVLNIFDKFEADEAKKGSKSKKRKLRAAGATRLKVGKTTTDTEVKADFRYIKCPITNKLIPEDKFDKHLQVLLADPHYKIEREKFEAKHKLSNLSSTEVYENIKKVAKASSPPI